MAVEPGETKGKQTTMGDCMEACQRQEERGNEEEILYLAFCYSFQ